MQEDGNSIIRRIAKFFYVSLIHDSLENYYVTNFSLMQHHKYSLTELENMMPFERKIYISLLVNYLEEEAEKAKQRS
jgi:hypothetical protein